MASWKVLVLTPDGFSVVLHNFVVRERSEHPDQSSKLCSARIQSAVLRFHSTVGKAKMASWRVLVLTPGELSIVFDHFVVWECLEYPELIDKIGCLLHVDFEIFKVSATGFLGREWSDDQKF